MKTGSRQAVLTYAAEKWQTMPDYPFEEDFVTAVLRHSDSRKWYGIIINVSYAKLGIPKEGNTDILNLKCDPIISGALIAEGKALPAYHMNKEHWISILLDSSITMDELAFLIDMSYRLVDQKGRKSSSSFTISLVSSRI